MRPTLQEVLLLEVHRLIADSAREAVAKFGKPVPAEARTRLLSVAELASVRGAESAHLSNPAILKSVSAAAARISVLAYPPDGQVSEADALALESLSLSEAQSAVLQRVVSEACQSAFFHFFCLLDAVADPELTHHKTWLGARLVAPREEGPMLHDDLGSAYYAYRQRIEG